MLAKEVEGIWSCNSPLEASSHLHQVAGMHTQIDATKRFQLLPPCLPDGECGAGKQISRHRDLNNLLNLFGKTGAGEGIRTLDPNLGNGSVRRIRAFLISTA